MGYSGDGIVLGASTTATGGAGAALLPNTGSLRVMFFVSVATLAIGITLLALAGASALVGRVRG